MKATEGKVKTENKKAETSQKENGIKLVVTETCNDRNCPFHGNLKSRGRIFKGKVIKKFHKRVVIELERMVYIRKYERYSRSRTRLHARLPECIEDSVNIGDYIKIQECRPLSKIVHFVVSEKLREAEESEDQIKTKKSKPQSQSKSKSKTKSKTKKKKRK